MECYITCYGLYSFFEILIFNLHNYHKTKEEKKM